MPSGSRAIAAHHDGGPHAIADADMTLPACEPIEALKDGAVGVRLESAPIPLDRRQILIDGKTDVARNRGRRPRPRIVRGRRIDADMHVKSCWDSLGHGRVSMGQRSKCDYVQQACTIR